MAYREFQPIAAFRHRVDAYWVNRRNAGDGAPIDRVLPDGCIDLIFCGSADGGWLFSSALIERPTYFDANCAAWYVGVRFRPAMARSTSIRLTAATATFLRAKSIRRSLPSRRKCRTPRPTNRRSRS